MYGAVLRPAWLLLYAFLAYMSMAVWAFLMVLCRTTIVLEGPFAFLAGHCLVLLLEAFSAAVVFVSERCRASPLARCTSLSALRGGGCGLRITPPLDILSFSQSSLSQEPPVLDPSGHQAPLFVCFATQEQLLPHGFELFDGELQ